MKLVAKKSKIITFLPLPFNILAKKPVIPSCSDRVLLDCQVSLHVVYFSLGRLSTSVLFSSVPAEVFVVIVSAPNLCIVSIGFSSLGTSISKLGGSSSHTLSVSPTLLQINFVSSAPSV